MTVRRYDPDDPRGAVEDVLSALGGAREFDDRLIALTARDERACDELFHALLTSGRSWPGRPGAHPRDVVEDGGFALVAAARAWPRRFLELTLVNPELHRNPPGTRADAHGAIAAIERRERRHRQRDSAKSISRRRPSTSAS